MSLDGISMHPLSIELDLALAGGRIDKINQPNKQSIIMALRMPGKNLLLHITISPQNPAIHIVEKAPDNPPEPPMFCMVLRKHLETGRIAGIRQYGLDRLLIMDIDFLAAGGKIITKSLIVELMGKYSNIILVQDGVIIDSLRKVGRNSSRVRTILPGDEYILPPQQKKLNLLEESIDKVVDAIRSKVDMKLAKAILDTCLGFGPVTAKEAAYGAGLPNNIMIGELSPEDLDSLKTSLMEIKNNIQSPCGKAAIVLDDNNKILAASSFPLHYLSDKKNLCFDTISQMLSKAASLSGSYQVPDKDRFRKLVKNELGRAENKVQKLLDDIDAANNAEEYRIKADNLMTYQYQFQDRKDSVITVANIYKEDGSKISIKMDQRLTVTENIQAYYKKYDKLKRGRILLEQQLERCREDIRYLSSIETSLESSTRLAEINDIKAEMIAGGLLREKPKKHAAEKQSQPFRYTAADGTIILVGKNNYQNDRLTFRIANPDDIWLHTQNIPGSHVILRCGSSQPDEAAILLACYLAVNYSQAKGSSKVPVDYTRVRFVKKPSGAKPGFVIFTNQTTLYVTPEPDILGPVLLQQI